ncbi:hypothetical protein QCA50_008904 [Cerrena zonata]|uniref:FAD/NAD(P)-binding domain-containing protein n=1 Tax=Cerrena zonata TaxID=2478898 RepID=A0AAW0G2X0_9APHY
MGLIISLLHAINPFKFLSHSDHDMAKKSDDRKNVVIIGGGFSGNLVAKTLSTKLDHSRYNLILVSARAGYIHLIAGARLVVTSDGDLENQAIIPYDRLFPHGKGTYVVGTVTEVQESAPGKGGDVVLNNGERIHYDSLVLATGSTWSGALNFPDADADLRATIKDWRNKFSGAKHVVIVGGGAVGIETAGEVKDAFPNKKVTIIHSEKQLLNDAYPEKFRVALEAKVRKANINLVLGDRIDSLPSPGTVGVLTRNGKELADADLVVPSFGAKPNTGYVASFDATVLTQSGFVKVDPTLQVKGHPGVFALGDIIDWEEQKQAAKANTHAGVVAANVLSYVTGQPVKKVYGGSPELIIIPIGK